MLRGALGYVIALADAAGDTPGAMGPFGNGMVVALNDFISKALLSFRNADACQNMLQIMQTVRLALHR